MERREYFELRKYNIEFKFKFKLWFSVFCLHISLNSVKSHLGCKYIWNNSIIIWDRWCISNPNALQHKLAIYWINQCIIILPWNKSRKWIYYINQALQHKLASYIYTTAPNSLQSSTNKTGKDARKIKGTQIPRNHHKHTAGE